MLILGRDTMKDPSLGYARTFVRQVEDCLGLALERGVRIVTNAGGLNPAGLADRLREVAHGLGLDPAIAHVEGDDLRGARPGSTGALTANAYLGGFGIAAALARAAPTSSSPAGSPTPRWSSGRRSPTTAGRRRATTRSPAPSWPATCSSAAPRPPAATSPASAESPRTAARSASRSPSSPPTARAWSPSTPAPAARSRSTPSPPSWSTRSRRPATSAPTSPPSSTRSGSSRPGPTGSAISGVRGEAPPEQLKVCVNELGGFRNTVEFVLTGLDIEAKADWVREQLDRRRSTRAGRGRPGRALPSPHADADTEEAASLPAAVHGQGPAADPVGKAFTAAAVELALASYPGFTMTAPPGPGHAVRRLPAGVRRPRGRRRTPSSTPTAGARWSPTRPSRRPATVDETQGRRPSPYPAPRRRRSPGGCRSAPSSTPAPATRAATPTSASGSPTTARRRSTTPGSPGCPSWSPRAGPRAGPGGGRPRRRGLPAAEPRRA